MKVHFAAEARRTNANQASVREWPHPPPSTIRHWVTRQDDCFEPKPVTRAHKLSDQQEVELYEAIMKARTPDAEGKLHDFPLTSVAPTARRLFHIKIGEHYVRQFLRRWGLSTHEIVWRTEAEVGVDDLGRSLEESLQDFVLDMRCMQLRGKWPKQSILNMDEAWFPLAVQGTKTLDPVGTTKV